MPVLLRTSNDLPGDEYDRWLSVTDTATDLPLTNRLPNLPRRLQTSFDRIRDHWLSVGKTIGEQRVGGLSHASTGAAYVNDLGLMFAWADLVEALAAEPAVTLVVCDDPWLFRHLSSIGGVTSGKRPAVWRAAMRLFIRGAAARTAVCMRALHAAIALRSEKACGAPSDPAIVVYGHPQSGRDGSDAYFGSLLAEMPELYRVLHTDCLVSAARELCRHDRTCSLHGWGRPLYAIRLLAVYWRMPSALRKHPDRWLVRRAIANENGRGALAMTVWQEHCQERWLSAMAPAAVAWPWENHPWERSFCRTARQCGIRTVGYQHAVIGRHQYNFSPDSNPDSFESLPGTILCNGTAYRDQLLELGHDPSRLRIGGAFRIRPDSRAYFDPAGPVYIALSSIRSISRQMLAAVSGTAFAHNRFVVKDHPLYPMDIAERENLKRTAATIPDSNGLRAVVYSTGTTGLEGLLAGVPTYRFLPDDRIAPDIMPNGVSLPECTADELAASIETAEAPPPLDWSSIMAPVSMTEWRTALAPGA